MADTYTPHESTSAATDYRKLIKCGALLPHETSCAMPMHRTRCPLRHSTPHKARPTRTFGISYRTKYGPRGPSAFHTAQNTARGVQAAPKRRSVRPMVSSSQIRNDRRSADGASPPTRRRFNLSAYRPPNKPANKKPAGTQTDPGRSADVAYVASRAARRP